MIELHIDGRVAEVVLNAPEKLNALDSIALEELRAAIEHASTLAEAGEIRALLLRAEGRAFCAGRDLGEVVTDADDAEAFLDQKIVPAIRAIMEFPAPSFAAGQGAALGAGLGILSAADVVYVAEDAKIGSPFAKLAMVLDSGMTWHFVERLGVHRTLDLMYTADLISGAEAVRAGLFSRAFPADELLERTRGIVARVAEGPRGALADNKRVVTAIRDQRMNYWEAFELENKLQGAIAETEDYQEGIAAFQEKRPPKFR
ncbi:enoyl-CoA hydratase/isomerase family protein [Acaricomes phytoseiuli]|uniref:enoyl-CoA hydratase/isomerase family protein n=1 Tax=Acaricomes phytoseiuli TaxID=291968 RepID=UPI00035FE846|nr:enoyl-CoA hydratase/isomerase family protein [Acaricomes phytoseiuli]MCW1249843.1 enoyl-CoA hydratase/isomerase family protein [Acaricomes phytoseiuli]